MSKREREEEKIVQFTSTSIQPAVRIMYSFRLNGKNQSARPSEAIRLESGETSCDERSMDSDFVAVFLGSTNLWYLLFREQTQASENPREHTQRHRYSI